MHAFRTSPVARLLLGLCIAIAAACERAPFDADADAPPVALAFQASVASAPEVNLIVVEVSGPGIAVPILGNFPVVNGRAEGTLRVPAGNNRVFSARGFDGQGAVTHEGSVTRDVRPNGPPVQIPLPPRGVGVPIEVTLGGFVVAIEPVDPALSPPYELDAGQTIAFRAVVQDAEGNPVTADPADLTWASTNPAVARVTRDAEGRGEVTGLYQGTAEIGVSYNGMAARASVLVDGALGPDLLEITAATTQASVASGTELLLTTTVRNRGSEPVGDLVFTVVVRGTTNARWVDDPSQCNILPAFENDVIIGYAFYCQLAPTGPPDNTLTFRPGDSYSERMAFRVSDVCRPGVRVEASIVSWVGPADPNLANNRVEFDVPVDCPPDLLEISLSTTTASVAPGGTIPVNATVTNRGTETVRDARFSLGGWPIQAINVGEPDCGASVFEYVDRQGFAAWPCVIPELTTGSSATIQFTLQTDASLCTNAVSVVGNITDWSGPTDPYLLNNRDSLAVTVACPQSITETARIAYTVESDGTFDLYTGRPDGTDERRVSSGGSDVQVAWSPDRTRLVYVSGGRIWSGSATGASAPVQLTTYEAASPSWSTNGTQIAVSTHAGSPTPRIRILNATTGATVRDVPSEGTASREPHWSPDGTRFVLVRGAQDRITVIAAETGAVISEHGIGRNPKWSPDGTRVAFWRGSEPLEREVFVLNVTTGVETRIAFGSHPSWSPNGSFLIFQRFQGGGLGPDGPLGKPDLLVMRADGTGVRHNITNRPYTGDMLPAW